MGKGQRIGLLIAAAAVLVVGFLIAQSSGGDSAGKTTSTAATAVVTTTGEATVTTPATPAAPPVQTIVVKGGKPQGGVQEIQVSKGDRVRFRVRSDVADEIHLHGYDLMKDVKAGGSVTFSFKASIDGKFEIELEGRKQQIAALVVQP